MSFMKNWMKKGPSKSDVLAKRKRDNEEAIKLALARRNEWQFVLENGEE